ncbi:transposase [methane-oxidizing endosymbiont of Gigantopelta aegis]|uniref:transposase n=1 Tax=methane-oxidizing endosymbiont of Gigantopelta aegis TaxID=2794938 RepID=UPI0018DCDCC6|nr:transposase [methane-oxidizing endosymbiont of Gigantopelta aegis]
MSQRYSKAFKEQAISKVLQRGDKTIQCIADELNVNLFTLKNWLKKPRTTPMTDTPMNKRPADWSMAERFALLMESVALEGEALNAFCRQHGIFPHHLDVWKDEFIKKTDKAEQSGKSRSDKSLRDEIKQLEKRIKSQGKGLGRSRRLIGAPKSAERSGRKRRDDFSCRTRTMVGIF